MRACGTLSIGCARVARKKVSGSAVAVGVGSAAKQTLDFRSQVSPVPAQSPQGVQLAAICPSRHSLGIDSEKGGDFRGRHEVLLSLRCHTDHLRLPAPDPLLRRNRPWDKGFWGQIVRNDHSVNEWAKMPPSGRRGRPTRLR